MVGNKTMKTDKGIPVLLTMKETCELLKVHPNTLRQWDRKGILKAVRFGTRKDRKYKKEEVLGLIESNT